MPNDVRSCKVTVKNCSGNASRGSKQYSLNLPTKWVQQMGITPEERDVDISFDGSTISVRKKQDKEGEAE